MSQDHNHKSKNKLPTLSENTGAGSSAQRVEDGHAGGTQSGLIAPLTQNTTTAESPIEKPESGLREAFLENQKQAVKKSTAQEQATTLQTPTNKTPLRFPQTIPPQPNKTQLEKKERHIATRGREIGKREPELEIRKREVAQRERSVERREQEIDARVQQLNNRSRHLNDQERHLNAKKQLLDTKNQQHPNPTRNPNPQQHTNPKSTTPPIPTLSRKPTPTPTTRHHHLQRSPSPRSSASARPIWCGKRRVLVMLTRDAKGLLAGGLMRKVRGVGGCCFGGGVSGEDGVEGGMGKEGGGRGRGFVMGRAGFGRKVVWHF